jgi:hypothetical protein
MGPSRSAGGKASDAAGGGDIPSLRALMAAMTKELKGTKKPAGPKDDDDEEDDDEGEGDDDGAELDLNLLASLSQSIQGQGGGAGPASNLLASLGVNVPKKWWLS